MGLSVRFCSAHGAVAALPDMMARQRPYSLARGYLQRIKSDGRWHVEMSPNVPQMRTGKPPYARKNSPSGE